MSQNDRLLEYLKKGGKVTTRDAMLYMGIGRLASRIDELKKKGVPIDSHFIMTGRNRRVKLYYLRVERTAA